MLEAGRHPALRVEDAKKHLQLCRVEMAPMQATPTPTAL